MSVASVKRQIRQHFDNRCTQCGMTNAEHLEKTGRSLDIDRVMPGSEYTLPGCVLLCKWCHRYRHGAKSVTVRGTGRRVRGQTRPVSFCLPRETVNDLKAIAHHLHHSLGLPATLTTALAFAIRQTALAITPEDQSC